MNHKISREQTKPVLPLSELKKDIYVQASLAHTMCTLFSKTVFRLSLILSSLKDTISLQQTSQQQSSSSPCSLPKAPPTSLHAAVTPHQSLHLWWDCANPVTCDCKYNYHRYALGNGLTP